ncbi:hypothetical protein DFH27DRAFT_151211 [Peziza echinospora]|nr:hypothetical protein DFH27DRAFT_151211 [Peziza echinospora]
MPIVLVTDVQHHPQSHKPPHSNHPHSHKEALLKLPLLLSQSRCLTRATHTLLPFPTKKALTSFPCLSTLKGGPSKWVFLLCIFSFYLLDRFFISGNQNGFFLCFVLGFFFFNFFGEGRCIWGGL